MLTRSNTSFTVVSTPTTSNSPACLISCSAQALSLPLDQAMSALGFVTSASCACVSAHLRMPRLPGEPNTAERLHQRPPRVGVARTRDRHRALYVVLRIPIRGCGLLDVPFHIGVEDRAEPLHGEIDHRRFTFARQLTPERAASRDDVQARPGDVLKP